MEEIWKRIPGHPDYDASSRGRVRRGLHNKVRGTSYPGKILRQYRVPTGYLRIQLSGAKNYAAHRLIATTFVPNPEHKPYVNHINGNKTDNRPKNLEWVTRSENQLHAYATGLMRSYVPATHGQASYYKNNGCRCSACREAVMEYQRRYTKRNVEAA